MYKLLIRYALISSFLLVSLAPCQSSNDSTDNESAEVKLVGLLVRVRGSNYDPVANTSVIPDLKAAFASATTDEPTRVSVAQVLVKLGLKDEVYWSLLYNRAQAAVNSQAPDAFVYDSSGKAVRGQISPAFQEWAKSSGRSPTDALPEQIAILPVELGLMATIGDPRGLSLLRKGLTSANFQIRASAALGLAVLQDEASVPAMIQAARTTPPELRYRVAEPLLAFDDPGAQAAAEELISDKAILADFKQRVKEKGYRGLSRYF